MSLIKDDFLFGAAMWTMGTTQKIENTEKGVSESVCFLICKVDIIYFNHLAVLPLLHQEKRCSVNSSNYFYGQSCIEAVSHW